MECCASCQYSKNHKYSCQKYKVKPWKVIFNRKICRYHTYFSVCSEFCDPFDAYLGFAIGDALGVPVEFLPRIEIAKNPVTGMKGYGSHMQPLGVWSDDTSLLLANSHALTNNEYDLEIIAKEMIEWMDHGKYSATGVMFGLGNGTRKSLERIKAGYSAINAGGIGYYENGNGSLMRILPLTYYLLNCDDFEKRKQIIFEVSSITHKHLISKIACHFLVELVIKILKTKNFDLSYDHTCQVFSKLYKKDSKEFERIFSGKVRILSKDEVKTSTYVIDTLEAVIWCITNTDNYKSAVLTAVNLGGDADTVGAITGFIATILYGGKEIPSNWINKCANKELIEKEAESMKNYIVNYNHIV